MQALNVIENPKFEGDKAAKVQVVKTDQLAVDALYLKPGQVHGPFRCDRDRALSTLSGAGEIVLATEPIEQVIALKPGQIVLAPRGTWHTVRNAGSDNLVLTLASQFPIRVEERG